MSDSHFSKTKTTNPDSAESLVSQTRALRALAHGLVNGDGGPDVVQDAFVVGLQNQPKASSAWLGGVVRRLCANARRGAVRRRRREEASAKSEVVPSAAEVVIELELQRRIAEAVLSLNEPHRLVIVLRFWRDLPPREIAVCLSVSVHTVKTRLQRALARLREALDELHSDDRGAWRAVLGAWLHVPAPPPVVVVSTGGKILIPLLAFMKTQSTIILGTALVIASLSAAIYGWCELVRGEEDAGEQVASMQSSTEKERETNAADRGGSNPGPSRSRLPIDEAAHSGRVLVTMRIVGERGLPVEGARVTGTALGRSPSVRREPIALSDKHGYAKIQIPLHENGMPLVPSLKVTRSGFAPGILKELWRRIKENERESLDLGDIRLVRGVAVRGSVVDADGRLLDGGKILLWDESFVMNHLFMARPVGEVRSDGSFELADRFGPSPAHRPYELFVVSAKGIAWKRIDVVEGQVELDGLKLRCFPNAELVVRAVDAVGKPIAGAMIRAIPKFRPFDIAPHGAEQPQTHVVRELFTGATDAQGVLRLTALPDPRSVSKRTANERVATGYTIVATAKGYAQTKPQLIEVHIGSVNRADVVLRQLRSVTIAGVVRTSDGNPVANVDVHMNSGESSVTTKSHDNGEFTVEGLALARAGKVLARVQSDDFLCQGMVLEFGPDQTKRRQDLRVWRRAKVTGRVLDGDRIPIEGARLSVGFLEGSGHNRGSLYSADAPTDATGRFAISNATDEKLELRVWPPEPAHAWFSVPMRRIHGGDRNLVVRLERRPHAETRAVFEIVDAATGEALAPSRCQLMWVDVGRGVPTNASPGQIVCEHLCPGRYSLTFQVMNHGRMEFGFEVKTGQTELRRRVEVGKPVNLLGVLHLGGLPSAVRARSYMVQIGPDEHVWSADGGGRGYIVDVKANSNGSFRFENVCGAKKLRVWLFHSAEFFAEAFVTTPSGGEVRVDLRPRAGGRVRIRSGRAVAEGRLDLEASTGNGPWRSVHSSRVDGVVDQTTSALPPGETRWRLRYVPRRLATAADKPLHAEGTVTVRVGETIDLKWSAR